MPIQPDQYYGYVHAIRMAKKYNPRRSLAQIINDMELFFDVQYTTIEEAKPLITLIFYIENLPRYRRTIVIPYFDEGLGTSYCSFNERRVTYSPPT